MVEKQIVPEKTQSTYSASLTPFQIDLKKCREPKANKIKQKLQSCGKQRNQPTHKYDHTYTK